MTAVGPQGPSLALALEVWQAASRVQRCLVRDIGRLGRVGASDV